MGSPIARIGNRIEIAEGPLNDPCTPITPIKSPIKRLPLSPRKMQAGCQLYRRNPARLPASAAAVIATPTFSSLIATRVSVPATIRPTPEARPSIPSIRFQMFMHPRNHKSVTTTPGRETVP